MCTHSSIRAPTSLHPVFCCGLSSYCSQCQSGLTAVEGVASLGYLCDVRQVIQSVSKDLLVPNFFELILSWHDDLTFCLQMYTNTCIVDINYYLLHTVIGTTSEYCCTPLLLIYIYITKFTDRKSYQILLFMDDQRSI